MRRFCLILFLVLPLYAESESSFERIRFSGLQNVSKHDLIREAGVYSKDGLIFVNRQKLEKTLKENSAIADFKIIDNKGVLTIVVKENLPEVAVYVVGRDSSRLCEVDSDFSIVTIGTIRRSSMPLIVLSVENFEGKILDQVTKERVNKAVGFAKNYPVWSQIDSLDFTEADYIKVTLKGRESVFEIFGDDSGFKRLNVCAGYLDSVEKHPAVVNLREKIFVY